MFMHVEIVYPAGFCYGVSHALNLVYETRKEHPSTPIVILGELVHNEIVSKELKAQNIETIKLDESLEENLQKLDKSTIIFFTAHGHPKNYDELIANLGFKSIDAICPSVKANNERIKNSLDPKKDTIYIGKSQHPETLGALSIDEDILLYDVKTKEMKDKANHRKAIVFAQTTLGEDTYLDAIETLKKKYVSFDIAPRACQEMMKREFAVKNIPPTYDLIYVVGSKNSSNANELKMIAVNEHPQSLVKLITSKDDIVLEDLKDKKNVALVSATSSPLKAIEEIREYLENL